MPGCKEGDMAVVLGAYLNPELIGTFVKVGKKVPVGFILRNVSPLLSEGVGAMYNCNGSDVFIVSNKEYGHWLHGDARLQPIRPPSLKKATETTKEKEHDFY